MKIHIKLSQDDVENIILNHLKHEGIIKHQKLTLTWSDTPESSLQIEQDDSTQSNDLHIRAARDWLTISPVHTPREVESSDEGEGEGEGEGDDNDSN